MPLPQGSAVPGRCAGPGRTKLHRADGWVFRHDGTVVQRVTKSCYKIVGSTTCTLDVLLSHGTGEMEKRRVLQDDYDIRMMRTRESKVSVMCNLNKCVVEKS